ncbi:MAG: UDP-N-acetylmuramoyl-tripeptide--D-alanyl-D-alanine ligase [Clostridia bacterium]|nr:UDP-N-acetylmuramoyl-tripeptide--D-alanyl-D-alanine ligase [Clostridia bacterium]MDD4386353.1 UDP-N-acetylmuramoyl-tripeptide--D-alanyl-D-alanine ligase [Clostridia bacterium]
MLNIKQILDATGGRLINGSKDYIVKDYALDSRSIKKDDFFIPIVGNKSNGHDYILNCIKNGICGYFIEKSEKEKEQIIFQSINLNKNIVIIEIINSQDALYDIGKFNRKLHIDIPIIAVTGSVGKTSTREMISSIFSQKYTILTTYKNYNGYIGLSLMLLKLDNQELAILEYSIDIIGEMDKLVNASLPNIAVVTMIGTAHIGIIGSQDKIFKEKLNIAKYMNKNCTLILNGDDKYLNSYYNDNINLIKYKIKDVSSIKTDEISTEFKIKIYNVEQKIKLNEVGEHNIYNVLASIRVAQLFKIEIDHIKKGIKEYKNQPRRFERIILNNNIEIIDDTYNASIDSMKSGIKAISLLKAKRKIVILGDMLELGNYSDNLHTEVGKLFKNINIDILFTLGEKAKIIAKEAKKHIYEVNEFDRREELIKVLCNIIKKDDLIREVKDYLENK